MKHSIILFVFIAFTINIVIAQRIITPKYKYLSTFDFQDTALVRLSGPARVIEQDGRRGLNTTSIHSMLEMKAHTLNEKHGAVTLWVMSLEDLQCYADQSLMKMI